MRAQCKPVGIIESAWATNRKAGSRSGRRSIALSAFYPAKTSLPSCFNRNLRPIISMKLPCEWLAHLLYANFIEKYWFLRKSVHIGRKADTPPKEAEARRNHVCAAADLTAQCVHCTVAVSFL
jgi:hypothetical protein